MIEREERKVKDRGAAAAMDSDAELDDKVLEEIDKTDKESLCLESDVTTLIKKSKKHSDLIKSIQYIGCTDQPLIMTGSTDRLVHLINFDS